MKHHFDQVGLLGRNMSNPRLNASFCQTKASEPRSATLRPAKGGFSLIEVTIAIGIVAFAFTAVVGLLPVGMRTAEDGHEQGTATEVLNTAAAAVFGQRYLPANGEFAFGDWLNDSPDPQGSPTGYTPGDQPWEEPDFKVMETGAIRPAGDSTSPVRYSMFIRATAPATADEPVKVYLSVAWPGTAEWDATDNEWKNNQGYVEALIYANPPKSL